MTATENNNCFNEEEKNPIVSFEEDLPYARKDVYWFDCVKYEL
jgi:hypothetical protein